MTDREADLLSEPLLPGVVLPLLSKNLEYFQGERANKLNEAYSSLLRQNINPMDDRLFCIISMTIIESSLDDYLASFLPRYEVLGDRNLNLYTKILLARSLNLTPSFIFDVIDVMRKIRNTFAHGSSITSLQLLAMDEKHKNLSIQFQNLSKQLFEFLKDDDGAEIQDFTMRYREACHALPWLLSVYAAQLQILNRAMRTPGFVQGILDECIGQTPPLTPSMR